MKMKKTAAVILALLMCLPISACQSAAKPENTVTGFFEAGKSCDTAKMRSFINPKNASSSSSSSASSDKNGADFQKYCTDYLKGNAKKITYNIKDSSIKDSSATVTVDCKYVDASAILKSAVSEYMVKAFGEAFSGTQASSDSSSKEISQLITDKIKTTKETFVSKTVKINCVKVSDKWYIDKLSDDLADVFLSGFVSAGNEISKSFNSAGSSSSNSSSKSSSSASASEFKNHVLTTSHFKIEITKSKVIAPGEKGNEYGDKSLIAFWYKTTNLSGEELDPWSAWSTAFDVIQDNNPNSVNSLKLSGLPDDKFSDTEMEKIKKGGTVENAISYELSDTKTPVTVKTNDNVGEQVFPVKK
ncbi:MAG: DUF5067 domain-containing protein [Oscillospiraceae bacterium]|jgi:predicted small secreted protein|nr:DUF5067 domain-containing protein [Oscillospiraceae bacterium]